MKHSNCLIEAIKAFTKDMRYVRIKKKGSIKLIKKGCFPHFYWVNNRAGETYHFEAKYSDEPLLGQLWFEGKVSKYNRGGKKVMLHYVEGDLLQSDCTVIMHQANCQKIMGAGIAKSIASMYPLAERVDKDNPHSPQDRYGSYTLAVNPNGVTVVNLYGQLNPGKANKNVQDERVQKLESAIHSAFHLLNSNQVSSINSSKVGLPYGIGCGLAGGDWEKVEKMLETVSSFHNIDIYLYKL